MNKATENGIHRILRSCIYNEPIQNDFHEQFSELKLIALLLQLQNCFKIISIV